MARVTFALFVAGLAASIISGCGGQSDEAKVRATLDTFYEAVLEGDGEKSCAVLAGAYQRNLLSDSGYTECPRAMEAASKSLGGDEKAKFRDLLDKAKLTVTVTGDHAKAKYETTAPGITGSRISLVKVDGTWYISGKSN